ncbi:hypothetical protein PC116_g27805 [Phytophthora cactorum]|uniref:Retrotransposon hot spot protein,C-terminal domain-containing protein n=2 Tax=Phytophthora cactorum TaxID=29920 RepID=A0A329RFH2_9STRA|nr:hypothetical protein PC112_g23487 [Phytophthora cactorum]KAG2814425.1 hypothetical protein PC113_g23316 [Phytophthora cactorum]KAG2872809.1 hypothetical protein PC114_g26178 [Phytophthora cactorum]KAG2883444.1 hypothetical protein PC117_g26024 [Phytophthora cactorum]KAG2958612.1 hypothetical protein PC118_g23437 [Phytophthora cactorum]
MLDGDTDAITITGTPGIGKSFFFGYFHVRCNFENPLVAIITASFKSKGEMSMMQSVVVRKNSEVVIETKVPSEMEDLIEEAEDKAKGQVIHLYDGPPDYLPEGARMVCFTSPNKEWFNQNEKDQYHSTLFMPLWSLHELQTTVTELGLEMDPRFDLHVRTESEEETLFEKLVEQRFYVFGGVARECLSTRANLSKTVKRESRIFWMSLKPWVKHNDF